MGSCRLTAVWVPDEAHEATRELIRLRSLAMRDQRRSRQQLLSFLLRHGLSYSGTHWSRAHRGWLADLSFSRPAQHLVLEELLLRIERAEGLCARLANAIADLLPSWTLGTAASEERANIRQSRGAVGKGG